MDDLTTDPRTRRVVISGPDAAHLGAHVRQRAAEIAISAQQRARLTSDPVLLADLGEIRRLALLLVGAGNLASTLPAPPPAPPLGWIGRVRAAWGVLMGLK